MIAPIIADKRAGTRYQHASKWGVTRSNATQNRAPCQEFWGLTRKLLSVCALGIVDFRSGKERVTRAARHTAAEVAKQTRIMKKMSSGS